MEASSCMTYKALHAELVAEVGPAEAFARLGRGWLTGCMDRVFGPMWERLRANPATRASIIRGVEGGIRRAGPDQVLGELVTYRKHPGRNPGTALYSPRSWDRFLDGLADNPYGVYAALRPFDHDGV